MFVASQLAQAAVLGYLGLLALCLSCYNLIVVYACVRNRLCSPC